MNCVIYARVSTEKQADKELSIPAQLQAMRDYARQHDWIVAAEFVEPGASARTSDRPILQQLLARCRDTEQTPPDVLLVHKIDRLARNVYDHATIKALLKQRGIRLASVIENVEDSVSGQLVENIMASIAQFYSANLAEEVRKGMRQKVLRGGWPHQPPRGYVTVRSQADGDKSALALHPREAKVIRDAFDMYSTGAVSVKAVAMRMAQRGITARSGRRLAHSYVRRMLSNPFYAGLVHWGDIEAEGTHPPLVHRTLFESVQTVLANRYRNTGDKGSIRGFPLRGLAICASCKGRMTAERHNRRHGYYRCGRNAFRSADCRAKYCRDLIAHRDLEQLCQQLRLTRPIAEKITAAAHRFIGHRMQQTQQDREALEREADSVLASEMRLTEAFTAGYMNPDLYRAKAEKLRSARNRIQAQITAPSTTASTLAAKIARTLQLANSLWDLYTSLADDRQASLLREVFGTIVLSADGIVGFTLNPPFDQLASAAKGDPRKLTAERRDQLLEAIADAA